MKKYYKGLLSIILAITLLFGNMGTLKAASASISVSSGTSKIVVGNSFSVTVKISSSVVLGSWEWTIDYDKTKFKLTSGELTVADPGDGVKKSASYTYKFKAIGTGSGKISVKSYGGHAWSDDSRFSMSAGSKTIKVISQAELQASYSKNNNLKSLGVEGYTLSPSFSKDKTEYTVQVGANTESVNIIASKDDSKSSVRGTGKIQVAEGDNKISVVVTAENGSTKTYTIIVTVKDDNPIEVKIDNETLTVVKRSSTLTQPDNYELKEIVINEIKVPSFYSEINNYYLVGLKNSDSEINLYIYNEKDNSYTLYSETKLNQLSLQPLKIDKQFEDYKKTTVKIEESTFEAYQLTNKNYYIIHARETTTGKDDYYTYDKENNTVIKYNDEDVKVYKEKTQKYYQIILLLCGETIIVFIILLIVLINGIIKNNKKRRIIKEEKVEKKEEIEKKKEIKEEKKEIKEEDNIDDDFSDLKKKKKNKKK